jgi:excinuclease UvrABC ATPase subunit
MNFDDREKKHDRRFNRVYLDFRKFTTKETCPTCNISPVMRAARDYKFDDKTKEVIKIKWVHDVRNCFSWYATIVMAGRKDRFGKSLTPEILQRMIESGFRMMNRLDKKFTEKGR